MKETPTLFSGSMVRALLNGSKTQTRRVVKPRFATDAMPCEMGATNERGHQISGHSGMWWCHAECNHEKAVRCPYGKPGDRIWVREKHAFTDLPDGTPVVAYAADNSQIAIGRSEQTGCDSLLSGLQFNESVHVDKWRPSIHMPRWASRITLEVTGVRVERLQEISATDCVREGITPAQCTAANGWSNAYRALWESINGSGSWEANPWVWVIEFRRLNKLEAT